MTSETLLEFTNPMKLDVYTSMAASITESYSSAYSSIVKLHIISEVESLFELMDKKEETSSNAFIDKLDMRLQITSPSMQIREPILNIRRALFKETLLSKR